MSFQEHAHDRSLGSTIDVGTNRLAQDPDVIRLFVSDNTLKTMLRNRIEGLKEILDDGLHDVSAEGDPEAGRVSGG
jgi:hypothetical protein